MAIWRVVVAGRLYGIEKWANVYHINPAGSFNHANVVDAFDDAYAVAAAGGGESFLLPCPGTVATGTVGVVMDSISLQAVVSPAPPEVTAVAHNGGQNTAGGLPVDTSVCISWQTAKAGRSFRGRTYLPPWHSNKNTDGVGLMPAPLATDLQGVSNNCAALLTRLDNEGARLCIYSRSLGTAEDVIGGYLDNEWDTQRRRSKSQPKTRHNFAL